MLGIASYLYLAGVLSPVLSICRALATGVNFVPEEHLYEYAFQARVLSIAAMALPLLLSHDCKGLQTFQDHLLCAALCPKWPSIANSYKVEISYNNI